MSLQGGLLTTSYGGGPRHLGIGTAPWVRTGFTTACQIWMALQPHLVCSLAAIPSGYIHAFSYIISMGIIRILPLRPRFGSRHVGWHTLDRIAQNHQFSGAIASTWSSLWWGLACWRTGIFYNSIHITLVCQDQGTLTKAQKEKLGLQTVRQEPKILWIICLSNSSFVA